ncbi:MAG TPA: hypothetical protein VKA84_21030 [Gemmatimonadaceae bacterium]|nr:hypothetical protein [Gemmatimonadaceae bacterium]
MRSVLVGAVLAALAATAAGPSPLGAPLLGAPLLAQQRRSAPASATAPAAASRLSDAEWVRLVGELSESGGFFDSDNLISNESSYLHVLGKMRRMGVAGGAYVGVGPDQNFSYIAQVRPRIAYLIDIRRDNMLEHLLFKALFGMSESRVEYLALLFGKPVPKDARRWSGRTLQEIVDYLDAVPSSQQLFDASDSTVRAAVVRSGLPLTDEDLATIRRLHAMFYEGGLDVRFTSAGRPPRPYYPTYRQLLMEKDLDGRQSSFLAAEADFQFVKRLEAQNLVVPVVGDLSGDKAVRAIAKHVASRGDRLSAFYTSNVEFYLMRAGSFERFADNLREMPRDARSVIVRSYFSSAYGRTHPQAVPGYFSTQLLQTVDSFLSEYASGGYQTYQDVVTKHSLELK